MALKVGDRIKQLTNSTGSGDVSFVSTPAGFSAFSSVLSSGDTTYYAITENDKYEVGIGTYGDSNMVRTTVLVSSNNNSHISLGGSGVVFITYPSDRSVFRNLDGQVVVGPSGLNFNNGTVIKNAKIGELTDVNSSGTPTSTHVLSFNHGNQSLLIGDSTGPSNSKNILIGDGAASGITSGYENVVLGVNALTATNAGIQNVSIGVQAGPYETDYSSVIVGGVSIGYQAGSRMRSRSTAIGYQAGRGAYEFDFVAIGNNAGYQIGSYSVSIGSDSGYTMDDDYYVAIGYKAGYEATGENSVWVGHMAGQSAAGATKSIGIGYQAGKSSSANDSIYIGLSAGLSNSNNDYLYIGNASPSSNGSLIKGDMQNKMLAVGAADVTLEDTLYVGIASATKKGLVVKSAAAQSALLTDWQTSAGVSVAALSNSGVLTSNAVYASGNGLKLADITPDSTTNTLYNVGGSIYWNGSQLATTGGSAEAQYASGQAESLNNVSGVATSLVSTSGIAAYASGNTANISFGSNAEGDILYHNGTTFTRLAKGTDNYILKMDGSVPNWEAETTGVDTYTSGVATYASGQAVANQSDIATNTSNISTNVSNISTNTARVTYASGQAIENQSQISSVSGWAGVYADAGDASVSGWVDSTFIKTDDDTYVSGIATYASGQAIANEGDIVAVSGIANYASGNSLTNATNIIATSGIANYASGQTIANQGNITALDTASGIATSLLAVSGTATSLIASSGIATYASGNTANISFGSNAEGDILYHNGTNFVRLAKGTDDYILKMNGNVPNWEEDAGGGGDVTTAQLNYVSGIAVYGSGQAISNQSNITALSTASGIATSLLSVSGVATSLISSSGIATYASGNSLTNATNIVATSGIANYASGQAIENESDITALLDASGTATALISTSGIATYASGNTANIAFGSNAEGDMLYHNGTSFARLAKGTDDYVLKMNGNVPNWEESTAGDVTTAQLNYVSGIAVYSSGQAIENEGDIVAVSGIANYASGSSITNATNIVATSGIANYASGQSLSLANASGVAAYASGAINGGNISIGEYIYHDGDTNTYIQFGDDQINIYAGNKSMIKVDEDTTDKVIINNGAVDIDFQVKGDNDTNLLRTDALNDRIGIGTSEPAYRLDIVGAGASGLVQTSGIIVGNSGIVLANNAPNVTSNTLYNEGGTLKFNGSTIGGGDVTTAQLNYVSGIAVYSSGQAIANESDILALQNVSGVATSLVSTSGIAVYASGNSLTNASNIIATSGIANYASGQALSLNNVSGVATSLVATSGIATYASGQATSLNNVSGVATSLVATSGIATYASGNTANIAFGSNAEGDMLYHNGTSFTRLAKGTNNHVLTMDGNVPNWEAAGGGGSPGGSDTQVQFNDGSSFGGDSDLVWNKTTNVLTINGTLMASLKAFVIDHPTKEGMRLQYGSLEGPENGVYVRGEIEGNNTIELPDYWIGLVDENSITVQLTPQHHAQPNLFVDRIEDNKVYLRSDKRVNAYYIVHATRKDVDPLEVEWPK